MTKSDERGQSEPVALWRCRHRPHHQWSEWYFDRDPTPLLPKNPDWLYEERAFFTEPPAEAAEIAKAVQAERERLAKAIEAELLTITLKDRGLRAGMALAASLVRRGRALTAKEKLTNLKRALNEYDDERAALSTPKESPPSVEEGSPKEEQTIWEWRWRDVVDRSPWHPVDESDSYHIEFRKRSRT